MSHVRGLYYAIHVRGYAVLPAVDIRSLGLLCHAVSHQYRVSTRNGYAVLPVVDIRSLGLLCHAVSHQYE